MKYIGLVCSVILFLSCLNDKNTPLANLPITVDSTTVIIPSVPAVNCSPDTIYFQQIGIATDHL